MKKLRDIIQMIANPTHGFTYFIKATEEEKKKLKDAGIKYITKGFIPGSIGVKMSEENINKAKAYANQN